MESFSVSALAEDDQGSRHRFGKLHADNGLSFGFCLIPESLEKRSRRVQAPRPSAGILGLFEKRGHETEHRGKVFRVPGGSPRVAFIPLAEIPSIVILIMPNGPCFSRECFDAARLRFELVCNDLSPRGIFGDGLG